MYPIGWIALAFGLIGGVIAYAYSLRNGWRTVPLSILGMLLVFFIAAMFMASTFTVARVIAGKLRHVLPGASGRW